ncbi:hypothetical protein MNV49_002043 [Pseudohyphozyma bogoriensis]|nr:hypothetical protein MNV49_002043 [Pseudohyphozyma bogoriensis]
MPMRSNTLTGGGGSWASGSRVGEEESTVMGEREMSKVRIKLRYRDDTRGMSISPDMELEDFVERVRRKFESPSDLPMRYKDSDGSMVSIVDPDDWQSALDEARENAGGRSEGKLEIFIDPN